MSTNARVIAVVAAVSVGTSLSATVLFSDVPAQSQAKSPGSQPADNRPAVSSPREPSQPADKPRLPYETRLWNWMQRVEYRNWAPAPGQNEDFYPGKSPHGAYLKMYLNRTAAANIAKPPAGAVIINENYAKDRSTLTAVTVMYKSPGYDPRHGDWYWVEYKPNGRVARQGDVKAAGRVKACIDCHRGAGGDDYLFAND